MNRNIKYLYFLSPLRIFRYLYAHAAVNPDNENPECLNNKILQKYCIHI